MFARRRPSQAERQGYPLIEIENRIRVGTLVRFRFGRGRPKIGTLVHYCWGLRPGKRYGQALRDSGWQGPLPEVRGHF
ncbi:hypothetical protein H0H87_003961 [Tephrocybe sp. NHM501043]|nr:hypothetical protein H0H87_003961 [Tephrocybe sp. NHM501043]